MMLRDTAVVTLGLLQKDAFLGIHDADIAQSKRTFGMGYEILMIFVERITVSPRMMALFA